MGQLQCSRMAIAGTTGNSTGSAAPSAPLRLLLALLLLLAPPASRTAVAKLWRTRTHIGTVPKHQERLRLLAAMAANCVPHASEPGRGPNLPLRLTAPNRPLPPRPPNHALTAAQPRRGVCRSQRSHEGPLRAFLPTAVDPRAVGVSCPWRRGRDGPHSYLRIP
jgi:hypothetical protein